MKAIVIVPTYREAQNVVPLVAAITRMIPKAHLLYVDDNSPDGTRQILRDLSGRYSEQLFALFREKKQGLGSAYVAGFRWALERDYDAILEMDADFSHNPQEVPRLLESLKEADVVLGSRYVAGGRIENWPCHRLVLSRFASWYARTVSSLPVRDPMGGFRAYRRKVLEAIPLNEIQSSGYLFQWEMVWRAHRLGFRIQEIPITFMERQVGKSKMNGSVIWEAFWKLAWIALTKR